MTQRYDTRRHDTKTQCDRVTCTNILRRDTGTQRQPSRDAPGHAGFRNYGRRARTHHETMPKRKFPQLRSPLDSQTTMPQRRIPQLQPRRDTRERFWTLPCEACTAVFGSALRPLEAQHFKWELFCYASGKNPHEESPRSQGVGICLALGLWLLRDMLALLVSVWW